MPLNIQNRRIQQRHKFTDAVTICPEGIGQVIDVSSGGISFKCRCEQCLFKSWHVDIVDSKTGIHLKEFSVEKVWESVNKKGYASIFATTVGVKFQSLRLKQQLALDELVYS